MHSSTTVVPKTQSMFGQTTNTTAGQPSMFTSGAGMITNQPKPTENAAQPSLYNSGNSIFANQQKPAETKKVEETKPQHTGFTGF
jgi:hypothetical protein